MRRALLALIPLAACAQPDDAAYPRLLPMSQLTAPPAIPAHAADAAADPQAVGDALKARRGATAAAAQSVSGPVTDATVLTNRARALQSRAEALKQAQLPTPAASPDAAPPAATSTTPDDSTDPAMAARIRALRDRAGALSSTPVGGATPLPLCPPGTPDTAAANCRTPD